MKELKYNSYKVSEDITVRSENDSIVVLNEIDNNIYEFNSVGKEIFSLVLTNTPIDEIKKQIAKIYETTTEIINDDIVEFFESLEEASIIEFVRG